MLYIYISILYYSYKRYGLLCFSSIFCRQQLNACFSIVYHNNTMYHIILYTWSNFHKSKYYVFFIHVSSNLNICIVLKWYVYHSQIDISKEEHEIDQNRGPQKFSLAPDNISVFELNVKFFSTETSCNFDRVDLHMGSTIDILNIQ